MDTYHDYMYYCTVSKIRISVAILGYAMLTVPYYLSIHTCVNTYFTFIGLLN